MIYPVRGTLKPNGPMFARGALRDEWNYTQRFSEQTFWTPTTIVDAGEKINT